jgi:hypothetical protein
MDIFEKYNSYSNFELFWIIENPKDYQPEALDIARKIISSRNLSEDEILSTQKEVEKQRSEKLLKEVGQNIYFESIKKLIVKILTFYRPTQKDQLLGIKLIHIISIAFIIISLLYLFKYWNIIIYSIEGRYKYSVLTGILYIFPLLYLAIATFLFFKKKRFGWTLIIIYQTYALLTYLVVFIMLIRNEFFISKQLNTNIPSPSLTTYTSLVLFWTLVLTTTCSKKVRDVFIITKKFMLVLLSILLIISILIFILFRTMI